MTICNSFSCRKIVKCPNRVIFGRDAASALKAASRRVGEDVTTLAPHRPERARFTHSVPHARDSLTMSWMPLEPSCAIDTH
jgi:hypothetical protein